MIHLIKNKNSTTVHISLMTSFLVGFMFFSLCLFSQDSLQMKIDNYVMQQQQSTFTPGVAVGVVKHGKVLLAKGYGLSNVELAADTDANSVFIRGGMAFNTAFLQFINDDITVIVLCNQTTCPSKQMAIHIASFLIPDLDYSVAPRRVIKESKKITELFKSVLLNAKNGKVQSKLFASEAQETAKFISRAGPDFLGSKGDLKSVNLVDEKFQNGKHSYTYQTIFEKATLIWKFELDSDDKILNLQPIEQ